MSEQDIYNLDNAPEASKQSLQLAREKFGFIPNVLGVLAGSPAALGGYLSIMSALEKSTLSPDQQQALYLAVSNQNECSYCSVAHEGAARACGLSEEAIELIKAGKGPKEAKLYALTEFARQVSCKQGNVSQEEVQTFLNAGFSRGHILDVIAAVAAKTISNYANHIFETPLDKEFGS